MKSSTLAIAFAVVSLIAVSANATPFATQVISSGGFMPGFDNPQAAIGAPTSSVFDKWANDTGGADVDMSMVYGAWGSDNVVSLGLDGQITVAFDTPITNNPNNPYGADFIIFGNAAFTGMEGWVTADTDMASYRINGTGAAFSADQMVVSVRSGGNWYTFESPLAGGYWPTQTYSAWDAASGTWDYSAQADYTMPMDPSLTPEDFGGLTVTDALALYNGSAGGTAFDIGALGLDEIDQIRVTGPGTIDAFARVSPVPEPATLTILLLGTCGILFRKKF